MKTWMSAKTLCDLSGWTLSNLPLQKMLYLSHMSMLGAYNETLIDGCFQAWDYGPVSPELYHKIKAYGSSPVRDIFPAPLYAPSSQEYFIINDMFNQVKNMSPGKLVQITHDENGAWSKAYNPNIMGIHINDSDIKAEYEYWVRRSAEARHQAAS